MATVLGTSLGTSLGTPLGRQLTSTFDVGRAMAGLSAFSAATNMISAVNGGELGLASGYGIALLVRFDKIAAGYRILFRRYSGATGYALDVGAGGIVTWHSVDSGGTVRFTGWQLAASDVGRVFLFTGAADGSNVALWTGRDRLAPLAPCIGYAPAAGQQTLLGAQSGLPFTDGCILSELTFRGTPSAAQMASFADATRTLLDLPEAMPGAAVTHRWSLRDELRGVSNPAGRKTYGLRTAAANDTLIRYNAGIKGSATGWWLAAYLRVDSIGVASATRVLISNRSVNTGHYFSTTGSNAVITGAVRDGSGTNIAPTPVTVSASDVGVPMLVVWQYDGANGLRTYARRTELATAVCNGYTPGASTGSQVFFESGYTYEGLTLLGVAGGHSSITQAEAFALFDAVDATGQIAEIPGKTLRLWNIHADVLAALPAVPTQVLDRIGADHLTKSGTFEIGVHVAKAPPCPAQLTDTITRAPVDALARVGSPQVVTIDPEIEGRRTLGAQGFSATSYYTAGASKGLRGHPAGFWLHWHGKLEESGSLAGLVFTSPNGASGMQVYYHATNKILTFNVVGPSGNSSTPSVGMQTATGKPAHVHCVYDGATGVVSAYYQGAFVSSAVVSGGGYTSPGVAPMTVGVRADGALPGGAIVGVYALQGGDGYVPTLAEINASVDETERTGAMTPIPGSSGATLKTQHLWDFTRDILASGVDAVPATVTDRIGTDHLTLVGTGLTLAPRTERLWSYETSPIVTGAALTDYATAGGFAGDPLGFMVELWFMVTAQTAGTRIIAGKRGPMGGADPSAFRGWHIVTTGVNNLIQFSCGASTNVSSPAASVAAGDIGKLMCFTGVYDAPNQRVRGYLKRMESGTGSALTSGYLASTDAFTLGRRSDTASAPDIRIFGFRAGDFVPTLAEVQSAHDRLVANEMMRAGDYGARPLSCLYRFPGGAPPALLNDAIGSAHLTRGGAPVAAEQYARTWAA